MRSWRRILLVEFMARVENTKLPKYMKCGELVGAAGCVGGTGKRVDGMSPGRPPELSVSTPTKGRLQPRTRGNSARRQKMGRNVSWQNGSLQRKSGLDYDMQ